MYEYQIRVHKRHIIDMSLLDNEIHGKLYTQ